MARIFLSYARQDVRRAERIAGALEDFGHELWWDREIGAGESFSDEIDRALADADLIVVLWSRDSVKSDWVRDEAATGRDTGRLLPVSIDGSRPPLGFRQYQSVDLAAHGSEPAVLHEAIERRLGVRGASAGRNNPRHGSFLSTLRDRKRGLIAAMLLIALAGCAWLLFRPTNDRHSVAVVPTLAGDQASSALARSVARDLGQLRAGPIGTLTIVDPSDPDGKNAEIRIDIGQSGSGRDLQADVAMALRGRKGIVWSSVIQEPRGRTVDLRQQLSARISDALTCLAELDEQKREIDRDSLSLYIRACANSEIGESISILRQLTARSPGFGPGWANLAMSLAWAVPAAVDSERPAMIAEAKAALAKALMLSPRLPETYVAKTLIRPSGGDKLVASITILDQAIAENPRSPILRGTRVDTLLALGRMKEAVAEARRARDLNPLNPQLLDKYVSALAYSGSIDAAYSELDKAERIWPGSSTLAEGRFRLDLRFGDPKRAEAYMRREGIATPRHLAFLAARTDPSPANIERVLADYRLNWRRYPADAPQALQAFVIFGKIDEAYEIVAPPVAADSLGANSDILFRPYFAKFRADPRFIREAKRIGLVDAWKKTGIWPDFCRDPALPYDCWEEAAKVRNVHALPTMA